MIQVTVTGAFESWSRGFSNIVDALDYVYRQNIGYNVTMHIPQDDDPRVRYVPAPDAATKQVDITG